MFTNEAAQVIFIKVTHGESPQVFWMKRVFRFDERIIPLVNLIKKR